MPRSAKSSATAAVTGTVAANTAIGTLEASMLDTATTSSITNSMKVPESSSTPTGWIRMNIQASPKNRSSMMKRSRQARMLIAGRRLGEELPAFGDDDGVDDQHRAVQVPAVTAPVQRLDRKPTVADQQQDDQRGGQPVLREQAQQLVVEGRPRAGGRGQPVARLAHALRGGAAALGRRPVGERGAVARLACWYS